MTKKKTLSIVLISVALFTSFVYFLKVQNFVSFGGSSYWRISNSKLLELTPISDQYIIDNVGESRFQNDFKLLPDKSMDEPKQKNESAKRYQIAYKYLPASKISGEQQIMYAILVNRKVDMMYGLSNCIKEPAKCNFGIDKNQAIEIAEKSGFITSGEEYSISFKNTGSEKGWQWVISKSDPKGSICAGGGSYILLDVSATDGKVGPERSDGYCP